MRNKTLLSLFLFLSISTNLISQNKTYNNRGAGQQNNNTGSGSQKIYNKTTVTVNKKVAQENHYNMSDAHLYYVYQDFKDLDSSKELDCMYFENPDSLAVYNIDIVLKSSVPFDTAYCYIPGFTDKPYNPFDKKSLVRDKISTISSNKTEYRFRAGYLAKNTKLIICIISKQQNGKSIHLSGVGKLW
jgi:hypothetical protein